MGIFLLGSSAPLYEGAVASRARSVGTADTTNKYLMARSAHVASEALTSIRVVFSNFYPFGVDTGLGASADITASIEYPANTFTQLTFSTSTTGTIPNIATLFSDFATVNIPSGDTFWVRTFWHNTAGTLYNQFQNTFLGEAVRLSATSIADQTMSGTITNSGSYSHPPIAILGTTNRASVVIVGDSISAGVGDTEDSSNSATGFNGKIGMVARSLGNIPFINLGCNGQIAGAWAASSPARLPLITKGSHMICEMGINDFLGAGTSGGVLSDIQAIFALCRAGQKRYQTTINPFPTSSDSWVTLGNQTVSAGQDAQRTAFNDLIRAGSAGGNGYYEVADVLESSRNSGKWGVTPTPPYTGDGVHPNTAGYAKVQASGAISGITWP